MSDSRNDIALSWLHINDVQHVPSGVMPSRIGNLKISIGCIDQNRGCEGSEGFAELDFDVHDFLHLRPTRIRDDTARTQRARAPLEAILKPSCNVSGCEMSRHAIQKLVF